MKLFNFFFIDSRMEYTTLNYYSQAVFFNNNASTFEILFVEKKFVVNKTLQTECVSFCFYYLLGKSLKHII